MQGFNVTGLYIHPFYPPTFITDRLGSANTDSLFTKRHIQPVKATAISDIDLAIGAKGGTIGATFDFCDGLYRPIRFYPGKPFAPDFNQQDTAILHIDRSFWIAETRNNQLKFRSLYKCHMIPPIQLIYCLFSLTRPIPHFSNR